VIFVYTFRPENYYLANVIHALPARVVRQNDFRKRAAESVPKTQQSRLMPVFKLHFASVTELWTGVDGRLFLRFWAGPKV
jgi:hypothetical protein